MHLFKKNDLQKNVLKNTFAKTENIPKMNENNQLD